MTPEAFFAGGNGIILPTVGISMRPLLREGVDSVYLTPSGGRLVPGDTAAFVREADGSVVLHRVIRAEEGGYLFLGDSQPWSELEYVKEACVLGKMDGFFRKDRYWDTRSAWYALYSRACVTTRIPALLWRAGRKMKRGI